jgi:hypothetical protein
MTSGQKELTEILTTLPAQVPRATPATVDRNPAEVRKYVTDRARACGLLGPTEELPERIIETGTMIIMQSAAGPIFFALTDECEREAITQYKASPGSIWTLPEQAMMQVLARNDMERNRAIRRKRRFDQRLSVSMFTTP